MASSGCTLIFFFFEVFVMIFLDPAVILCWFLASWEKFYHIICLSAFSYKPFALEFLFNMLLDPCFPFPLDNLATKKSTLR